MPASWRLQVLGVPRLVSPDGSVRVVERRTAALMAYLALEGPTARARLVSLLWPDTRERAGRNNLVQLLRRQRAGAGRDLTVGGELLSLSDDVSADVHDARALHERGRHDALTRVDGALLQDFAYDDCPDLHEWVTVQRAHWQALLWQATRSEAERLERAGAYVDALGLAARLVQLDPLAEEGYRWQMRAHYLLGQREAASRVYDELRVMLRSEMQLDPLPETRALHDLIARGDVLGVSTPGSPNLIPLGVLRPPTLVGRDDALRTMRSAVQQGQVILLTGEAGIGKTRLATDFAARHGRVLLLEGRPGDAAFPYATTARHLKRLLDAAPTYAPPDWVKRQLARLLPELGSTAPLPSPDDDTFDEQRLIEAHHHVFRGVTRQYDAVVMDDWHFQDAGSARLGQRWLEAITPLHDASAPRVWILGARPEELGRDVHDALRRLVDVGHVQNVKLGPLDEPEARALLHATGLTLTERARTRLARFAQGSPLYLLETLKHLIERGRLHEDLTDDLHLPQRVEALLERRLSRLSSGALHVARAAAIVQSHFDVELVSDMLDAPWTSVADAWAELEAAQIINGHRFTHDLLLEAVRRATPSGVRTMLHRRAARALERRSGRALRIARHWLHGEDPRRAAAALVNAAEEARAALLVPEALALYEQAADVYESLRDADAAFEARLEGALLPGHFKNPGPKEQLVRVLARTARTTVQRAQAHLANAHVHLARGRAAEAEAAARAGERALGDEGGSAPSARHTLRAALSRALALSLAQQVDQDALRVIDETRSVVERTGDARELGLTDLAAGTVRAALGQHAEATEVFERAVRALRDHGSPLDEARALLQLALNHDRRRQYDRALALRLEIEDVLKAEDGPTQLRHNNAVWLATYRTWRAEYREALSWLHVAERTYDGEAYLSYLHRAYAELYWSLGAYDACDASIARVVEAGERNPLGTGDGALWTLQVLVHHRRHRVDAARDALSRAQPLLSDANVTYARARAWLAHAELCEPAEALQLARRAVRQATTWRQPDLKTLALTVEAEALLGLGRVEEATERAREAVARFDRHPAREEHARPWLTLHRALSAGHDVTATNVLQDALTWLAERVRVHVPDAHLATFLHEHHTHRELLALAVREGVSLPAPLHGVSL